jgi:hypothetical protein
MVVPGSVDHRHEPHATLDQAAGEQTVPCELLEHARPAPAAGHIGRFGPVAAVHVERRLRLLAQIDQLRSGRLHAEGQLIAGDAAGDFGVLKRFQPPAIQVRNRVEVEALQVIRDPGRIGQIEDRIALVAEKDSLIGAG